MFQSAMDMPVELRTAPRGGSGDVAFRHILPANLLPPRCRLFSTVTLQKGDAIGKHAHCDDAEIYYMLSGQAQVDDDGTPRTLFPGDRTITQKGAFHSITNLQDQPATFLAVILED